MQLFNGTSHWALISLACSLVLILLAFFASFYLLSFFTLQGSADKAADGMLNRSGAVGTEALMGVLKNYCRSLNLKTAITVGVIGYPNVGKSSLINSLKR